MRIEPFLRDVRLSLRMLRMHPALSIVVVLTLGLGIGLSSTVFNITNGFVHKELPFDEPDRILGLGRNAPAQDVQRMGVTVHDLAEWRRQQSSFEGLAAFGAGRINLSTGGAEEQPERYYAAWFTPGVFEALRVQPALGRTFREEEGLPGANPVIVVGHALWQARFDGAPDVLGRTVVTDGVVRTIVGVMPEGFMFPNIEEAWLPLEVNTGAVARGEGPQYSVIGRLRDGVSRRQARTELETIAARLEQAYPDSNEGVGVTVRALKQSLVPGVYYGLFYTMLGLSLGVLLVGCVNIASLLLARATERSHEIAVRTALGAGRGQLVAQLSTEMAVLALLGGCLGFGLGHLGLQWFLDQMNNVLATAGGGEALPFWIHFEHDYRVVLFVVVATLMTTVFAGVLPAFRASRAGIDAAMKGAGRGFAGRRTGRLTGALVVAEITVSCLLLVMAGLMIKGVVQLNTVDLGYATEGIFTARVQLPQGPYPDVDSRLRFHEELLAELEAIPGVAAANLSDSLPPTMSGGWEFEVEGRTYSRDEDYVMVRRAVVTPGYFDTFEAPVLQGREFTGADRRDTMPVAVVNETFARSFFADGEALGRRIRAGRGDSGGRWLTVVGVVPDLKAFPMEADGVGAEYQNPAAFYVPMRQSELGTYLAMALKTQGEPTAIATPLRSALATIDPDLPIYMEMSMENALLRMTWFYPLFGTVFTAFGLGALLLAVVGLYGLMSFTVSRRTREMGLRMAVGARNGQLVGLVMTRSTIQAGIGIVIGLALSLLAATPLRMLLFEVDAYDPSVFGLVVLTLAATALVATLVPARRVVKVNPMKALTSD